MQAPGIHEVNVPGGYAESLVTNKDHLLAIVDVEGQQVADFVAFNEYDDHE